MRRNIDGPPRLVVCLLFFIFLPLVAAGDLHAANIRVIDGDTLVLDGETIRLDGIDAPEMVQACLTASGRSYRCGRVARDHLQSLIATSTIRCEGTSKDAYGRRIGTCYSGARNLNETMVEDGQAYAFLRYSDRYEHTQEEARRNGRGIWAGISEAPWDFRKMKWQAAGTKAPEGCPIKGNISANGRIYHTPWSPHYTRTRINEAAGERWFCSEEEAVAAGWRPPLSSSGS